MTIFEKLTAEIVRAWRNFIHKLCDGYYYVPYILDN